MRTCGRHETSLALYVAGDLHAHEVASLERHLEACRRCQAVRRELEWSQSALEALAAEPLPEGALDVVRARVLAETGRDHREAPSPPRWVWASAAAVIACLALAAGVVRNRNLAGRGPSVAALSDASPSGGPSAATPTAAPPSPTAPSPASPPSTVRRVRAEYESEGSGSEGAATSNPESALTPGEADQLARAVVALYRIERLSDVPAETDEEMGGPLATQERSETPPRSSGSTATLVRWTTADPDVVIYWQLDSNGGES